MENTTQANPILAQPPTRLLRAADVAARLDICKSAAYKLVREGKLRRVCIGKSVRIHPDDLDEYIEAARLKSQAGS